MSKLPKPAKKSQPPLPPVGHYVLMFRAPDGAMHDPPIPLDQRLTDAELRELVDGVHAKLKARQAKEPAHGTTINRTDELPGGTKLEPACESAKPVPATVPDLKVAMGRLAEGKPMSPGEADRVLAANGIPPARSVADAKASAHGPKKSEDAIPAGEGWGDAAGAMIYKGACLFSGACVLGAGVIIGGCVA